MVLSGDVLSQWLQRRHGSVVVGSRISLTRGGFLRVSEEVNSHPVQVALPVMHGGQAAVARAVDQAGTVLALRVQAVSSTQEKARQMERLVNMTTVATAAQERPERFPAVLPVLESFVLVVPGAEMPLTGPEPEYELWCDLMTWCVGDLNAWQNNTGQVRSFPAVLAAFVPVAATVHAVHEDLGIVHRDITPNNVLVDSTGRLLLADWGIAHGLAEGQTSTYTQLVGNRGFSLPPEMLAGDSSVGRYTDAWYLGSLLAWMLTGQTPGPQHGPTWLPPGLPAGPMGEQVAAVIQGLCQPDPRQRLDLAQAGRHLQATIQGQAAGPLVLPDAAATAATRPVGQSALLTVPQPPGGTAGPAVTVEAAAPGRWSRSKVALVAVGVLVVLGAAALAGFGGLTWFGDKDSPAPGAGGPSAASQAQGPDVEGEECVPGTWEMDIAGLLSPAGLQVIEEMLGSPDFEESGTFTFELTKTRHFTSTKDAIYTLTDDPSQQVPFREVKEGSYRIDGDSIVFVTTEQSRTLGDGTSRVLGAQDEVVWSPYTCSGSTMTATQVDTATTVTMHRK